MTSSKTDPGNSFFRAIPAFLAVLVFTLLSPLLHAQSVTSVRPGLSGTQADTDGAEFSFARLMYGGNNARSYNYGRSNWTVDMPEAEHYFMEGVTRLTRVDGRKVNLYNGEGSEFIDLNTDTVFDYPFLYAVEVGSWSLSAREAETLREYLLRGGFMIVDDFHGTYEWEGFVYTMRQVFPDRPIIDIPEDDAVFHVLYDLDQKIQIPGIVSLQTGRTWEDDGYNPHWRGIYDDDGRLIVAINHNMDLGDAWEHADTPDYPEPMTGLAYRFAVNYVIYAMTH